MPKDENTALYYYGARYYDPRISLWHGVDPLAEDAPDWTPYRYGFNNPINYMDPDGMFETEADAKQYANDNGIKTNWFSRTFGSGSKITQNKEGHWSIDNKKTSIFQDKTLANEANPDGIFTASLITDYKINTNSTSYKMVSHYLLSMESLGKSINENNGDFGTDFESNVLKGQQNFLMVGVDVATMGVMSNSVGDGIGNGNSKNTLKLPTIKLLRGRGGNINGITISRGSGYGSKPRFDIHPLKKSMKSRKESKMTIPDVMDGWYLPHYHRGKGNNLKYHRPWEVGPDGKRKW